MSDKKRRIAQKVGEFIAYSIIAIGLLVLLIVSVSITYFIMTWAFGLR